LEHAGANSRIGIEHALPLLAHHAGLRYCFAAAEKAIVFGSFPALRRVESATIEITNPPTNFKESNP
jgi:hypothetical protein